MPTGRRPPAIPGWWRGAALALLLGCARKPATGELAPPPGTDPWDVRLVGRAPSDVADQRRFAQRLGYADLVALVTVDQVWSRGLYGGAPKQRLDVTLGRVLHGELPKGTTTGQVLELRGEDELPAALAGRVMLLFLHWAPGERPAFHHHVMPADDDMIALIEAMVRHARAEGQLEAKKPRRTRRRGEG
jgi:hypothetical protein